MFLQNLTPEQQKTFFDLAHQLAQVDGTVLASEATLLKTFRAETGLNDYEVKTVADLEQRVAIFNTHASKAAVCLELLGIGFVDSAFSAEEMAFIERVAETMAISPDELRVMENWVLRQMLLVKEAQQFFED